MDISVIIVNWNVRELLLACLESLREQTGVRHEIIVVDNASRDESAEAVERQYPKVTLIANKNNRGFARANNQGIRLAKGRHILLLNPDTVVRPDTLRQTVAFLDNHPDIGILGCKILNRDGSRQRSIRRDPSFSSQALILAKLHAFFPKLNPLRRYFASDVTYDHEQDVEQVMGAFLAFRASLTNRVGLLDEGFFLWFEEVDFCKRVRAAGLRIVFLPSITITHFGGESFGQLLSIEQQLIFNRSLLRYARKHLSPLSCVFLTLLTPLSLFFALLEPMIRRHYVPRPI